MLKTNKCMYMLLGSLIIIHSISIIFNTLFYLQILGPNSNKEMKNWFFDQIKSNMTSRALNEINLEPIAECSFPMLNVFDFGYPRADAVSRHCMCNDDGDFSKIDDAIAKGEDFSTFSDTLSCKLKLFDFSEITS